MRISIDYLKAILLKEFHHRDTEDTEVEGENSRRIAIRLD
ncbi:hypothetical protein CKA32_000161 [Geitlerinema sp. FC II]|nr:hypothetical protein CKA32_000161 [Geitlerinema sp. FC II]